MSRVLLAGVSSGCGKTTLTCGLLRCLKNRGLRVTALKCGPDYIDPMFHSRVLETPSFNLDPFFLEETAMRGLLRKRESQADIAVLEGTMGFYDGIGFTDRCSSSSVARITDTPVILVIDCRGMGASVGAVLKGFSEYRSSGMIQGVVFNRLSPALYPAAAEVAEGLGIRPLGYLPRQKEWSVGSRHLGLIPAGEIPGLREQMDALAEAMEKTVDIDGICALAQTAAPLPDQSFYPFGKRIPAKIAVASDEAFCFTYPDNMELLRELGCTLLPFSPLRDKGLPEGAGGLLLSGGYPELHGRALSENTAMRSAISEAIRSGMPCIAECGGFLYLQEFLEDSDSTVWPMAGVLPGKSARGEKLEHFGYITVTSQKEFLLAVADVPLKAHEFHYWQTDSPGKDLRAVKAGSGKTWDGGAVSQSLYAGFPHFYFYGNPGIAERFAERCVTYELERTAAKN